MEPEIAVYLRNMNDEELGLFWMVASESVRLWIKDELVIRAQARGEVPVTRQVAVKNSQVAAA